MSLRLLFSLWVKDGEGTGADKDREVWKDGFQPYDRALRNILWEGETGTW